MPKDLANTIIEMIESENIEDMRDRCKEKASYYDKSIVMEKWNSLFKRLLKNKNEN